MIDAQSAQQNIYVEYQNLSRESHCAEMQKDILSQFIRKIVGYHGIIFEYNHETDSKNIEKYLKIKCDKCYELKKSSVFLSNSLSESKAFLGEKRFFNFQTHSFLEEPKYWYVQLEERKKSYYLSALGNLKQGTKLNKQNLQINSCFVDYSSCKVSEPLDDITLAEQKINEISEKNLTKNIGSGEEILSKFVYTPKVIHANDSVKIYYENNAGLTIKAYGKALSNGAFGESVKIEINLNSNGLNSFSSKKIINAMVTAPGEVRYVGN
ncbi:MAG: flagella basal body P-ring formation protein FlgA [Silvanigrellaceae bacterium]|nr:flagella basal body P-ring formation protein FlgA [Silvanigrellaceae bacterium]